MKIAVIGLGRMGAAIAGRLIDKGHEVAVYNRSPDKARPLEDKGARVAGSIADAVNGAEAAITMLADDTALEDVCFRNQDNLIDGLGPDTIHLPMGTHGIAAITGVADAHDAAGRKFVACPVLGRPEAASAGQLGIVPAGPDKLVEACAQMFEDMGRAVYRAGTDPKSAISIKIAHNFTLGCAIEAMGEATALVRKYGVPPEVLYNVLTDALFACPAYKIYGEIIAQEDYGRVGITCNLGLKDANLALQAGEAAGVPLPSGGVWRERLIDAIAHGDGEKDWAVVGKASARAANLK